MSDLSPPDLRYLESMTLNGSADLLKALWREHMDILLRLKERGNAVVMPEGRGR